MADTIEKIPLVNSPSNRSLSLRRGFVNLARGFSPARAAVRKRYLENVVTFITRRAHDMVDPWTILT